MLTSFWRTSARFRPWSRYCSLCSTNSPSRLIRFAWRARKRRRQSASRSPQRDGDQRSVTLEFTLLTFWPPGPLLRAAVILISFSAMVRRELTYKLSHGSVLLSIANRCLPWCSGNARQLRLRWLRPGRQLSPNSSMRLRNRCSHAKKVVWIVWFGLLAGDADSRPGRNRARLVRRSRAQKPTIRRSRSTDWPRFLGVTYDGVAAASSRYRLDRRAVVSLVDRSWRWLRDRYGRRRSLLSFRCQRILDERPVRSNDCVALNSRAERRFGPARNGSSIETCSATRTVPEAARRSTEIACLRWELPAS